MFVVGLFGAQQAATPSPGVARRGSQRLSTSSDDYLEEAEVEGNFKPLIPLPEEVSVCTGEENEKVGWLHVCYCFVCMLGACIARFLLLG